MMLRPRPLLLLVLLCLSTAVMAGVPPQLVWRGDITTANNFVRDMAKAWHKDGHRAITLEPFNTISGIDAVVAGRADIGGSVRGRAPRRGSEANLVFTPVAWDALVIVANPRNPVSNLTLKQLHDIYFGRIHNWKEVGGPDLPIHVYAVASPTDGIEFSLRRLLFGRGNQPVAAPRLYLTIGKLQRAIELDPQAMGVTTLSNAHDQRKLKMLAIDGTAPSRANVRNGKYPLYTPLYLVTRHAGASAKPTPKRQEIVQFLAFAQSPAVDGILHQHDLIPYADALDLSGHDAERIAAIAAQTGRAIHQHQRTPRSAPRATYAARAAVAPTSERTVEARQRMQDAREETASHKTKPHADKKSGQ